MYKIRNSSDWNKSDIRKNEKREREREREREKNAGAISIPSSGWPVWLCRRRFSFPFFICSLLSFPQFKTETICMLFWRDRFLRSSCCGRRRYSSFGVEASLGLGWEKEDRLLGLKDMSDLIFPFQI